VESVAAATRVAVLIACLSSFACTPALSGALTAEGYRHNTYHYQINAMDGSGALLPDGWAIDNLYEKRNEGSTVATTAPKDGPDYMTEYVFDTDGDGKDDLSKKALAYDLRYVHRVHSGVIWVRTVPISQTMRDKDLRVLMKDYIDGVAGAGYERVSYQRVEEKRFAAETLSRQAGTVAGMPAFAAQFAVANIDEVQVNKEARRTQVRLVIVRSGFNYVVKQPGTPEIEYPVLLVMGYASQPEDYDQGVRDFDDLVERVSIDGKSGVTWEDLDSEAAGPSGAASDASDAPPVVDEPPEGESRSSSETGAGPDDQAGDAEE
jgi:hypothetical protein